MFWLIELRFYSPVNTLGSCPALSVYLTTHFLDELSPLSLTSTCAHSFARTDNCPSWISWRKRMTIQYISWSISKKACCRTQKRSNPRLLNTSQMSIQLSHRGWLVLVTLLPQAFLSKLCAVNTVMGRWCTSTCISDTNIFRQNIVGLWCQNYTMLCIRDAKILRRRDPRCQNFTMLWVKDTKILKRFGSKMPKF